MSSATYQTSVEAQETPGKIYLSLVVEILGEGKEPSFSGWPDG